MTVPEIERAAVRLSARTHYAVWIMTRLAAAPDGVMVKAEAIARHDQIPRHFLDNIVGDLRRAGLVETQRGSEGGSRLALPAAAISLADVLVATQPTKRDDWRPPLGRATVPSRDDVWLAVQAGMQALLERITISDLADGVVPSSLRELLVDVTGAS
jgi:Rrf2 family protein